MITLKILFSNVPGAGHFNPLTGLAVHLKNAGHDVRWYTQNVFEEKIKRLGIHYYPFRKAIQHNHSNLDEVFPERLKHKSQLKKLNHYLRNVFVLRATEFFEDIQQINEEFPFDVMIADVGFTAIPFVPEILGKPVLGIGIIPLMESSKDLPPYGLGLTPSKSFTGKIKQNLLRWLADKVLIGKVNKLFQNILVENGITPTHSNIFDTMIRKSTLVLQSGTPGFEYERSDFGKNIRFMGALLPYQKKADDKSSFSFKFPHDKKLILVTQGTVEKNVEKIIVPTLEALKNNEDYLVVATTGGSQTQELRSRYPQVHFIIEDFIPFEEVMPHTDVFITNGGYGGVLLGIQYRLPMVVAGVHEGKNEINARVAYFKLGIDLKTETPKPKQIYKSTMEVLANQEYRQNVERLSNEFTNYDPNTLCEQYVNEVTRSMQ